MEDKCFSCRVSVACDWVEELSRPLMGSTQVAYTSGSNKIIKCWAHPAIADGISCYLQLSENLAVLYTNMHYHNPIHLQLINEAGRYFQLNFCRQGNLHLPVSPVVSPLRDPNLADTITLTNCHLAESRYTNVDVNKTMAHHHGICLFMRKKTALEMGTRLLNRSALRSMFNPHLNAVFVQYKMDPQSRKIITDLDNVNIQHAAFGWHLSAAAWSLLANFQEIISSQQQLTAHKVPEHDIIAIEHTLQYMMENIETEFPGLEVLAMKANMSVSKYKLLFGKIHGIAPKQLFIEQQLELAKSMLESGRYKVIEVCQQLGYSNPGFFSRQFKKKFGVSPRWV